jgi:hypothetical protein
MKPRSTPRPSARQGRPAKSKLTSQEKQSQEQPRFPTGEEAVVHQETALLLPESFPLPETLPVHISLFEPTAHRVFVAGTFNDWQPGTTALTREGDGYWSVEIMLRPGRYEYRLVVDGEWKDDPLAQRYTANPFGGLNSVMEVQHSQPSAEL